MRGPPTPDQAEDRALVPLLRSLGNVHRYRVFQVVAGQALRGKDVSEVCGISPQEASRHLGRLAALGLVERGPDRAHRATELGRRVHARLQEVAQSVAAAQAMPKHAPPSPSMPIAEGFLAPVRTEEPRVR